MWRHQPTVRCAVEGSGEVAEQPSPIQTVRVSHCSLFEHFTICVFTSGYLWGLEMYGKKEIRVWTNICIQTFAPIYNCFAQLFLNLNEFLSSAEHTCYFEEGGKKLLVHSDLHIIIIFFFINTGLGQREWVNNDRNKILAWTIPLMTVGCMFSSVPLRPARI